jgi:hypothetical protein
MESVPGQHIPVVPVHNSCQIEKAPGHGYVGDIGRPDLVYFIDCQPLSK